MFRRFLLALCSLAVLILFAGCANQIVVPEVLQQPLNGKIYTKSNIWYQNPAQISSLNYQTGRIIPFGTEVIPVKATDYLLVFKTKDGQQYTILFDPQLMLVPMRVYIKQMFTLKPREDYIEGMNKEVVATMLKGLIKRGMTKKQVIMTCGLPPACRTPSTMNSTWIYYLDKNRTFRVVFRGQKVKAIININDEELK
ncbi:hypothetical protein P0136_07845 [Lentisphaerota bacterium ZTH]|nr:hypothetical protein JYG24_01045 [Lentisphaerota bacterium]WET05277.1 hypothetical protein P0136_07845 [Lentisphaerota bacterium ZTH]